MALTGNEIVFVIGLDPLGRPSGGSEQTTTGEIANLAGGGVSTEISVLSGTSSNVLLSNGNCIVLWDSASLADKSQTIPTSTGSGQTIIVKDVYGNSETYPIIIAAVSGLIDRAYSSVQISTANGWVTLKDTSLGWMIIG